MDLQTGFMMIHGFAGWEDSAVYNDTTEMPRK